MAKRARMTVDEVVQGWDDASDDDFDDPIMEGSDDEFSDLGDVDECDGTDDLFQDAPPPEDPAGLPGSVFDSSMDEGSDTNTSTADSQPEWSTTLKRNTINSFSSPVDPSVAISWRFSSIFSHLSCWT